VIQSHSDKRGSFKREKAYPREVFLFVLTRFTGRLSNVKRDYPAIWGFTRIFPLPLIEVRIHSINVKFVCLARGRGHHICGVVCKRPRKSYSGHLTLTPQGLRIKILLGRPVSIGSLANPHFSTFSIVFALNSQNICFLSYCSLLFINYRRTSISGTKKSTDNLPA
jgi:hypothetical protein